MTVAPAAIRASLDDQAHRPLVSRPDSLGRVDCDIAAARQVPVKQALSRAPLRGTIDSLNRFALHRDLPSTAVSSPS
jgi:hypothetical protein